MDRRFSLALLVSLAFVFMYVSLTQPKIPPRKDSAAATTEAETENAATPETPVGLSEDFVATDAELDEEILVDTDLFRARLSNRGAVIRELFSKVHSRSVESSQSEEPPPESEWLPYIQDMDPEFGTLGLRANSGDGPELERAVWAVTREAVDGGEEVRFRLEDGAGMSYEKVFRFRNGLHAVDVEIRIANQDPSRGGTRSFLLTAAGNMPGEGGAKWQRPPSAVVVFGDDPEFEDFPGSSLSDGDSRMVETPSGSARFFGSHTNFFAAVLEPLDEATAGCVLRVKCEAVLDRFAVDTAVEEFRAAQGSAPGSATLRDIREDAENNARAMAILEVPMNSAEPQVLRFQLFAGPKDPGLMEDERYAAFRTLYIADYKRFAWINKTLLWTLRRFHDLTGNWGVAIILLTVLVKTLLFPMNRMQSRTMEQFQKKMAKLKPQLEEMKKKYKNNTRKFHEAQQKLMREHQVRPPVFGCLILFLQFPVFIGLFQILRTSFELRHQPFFGWIDDLSQPDALGLPFALPLLGATLNVLPLLMMASMVVHTKLMPKPADPQAAQMQKMMLFMPFIFGVFLYSYASGLSLYMLTNALLGIVQAKFLKVASA